jgi:hypothetical protein
MSEKCIACRREPKPQFNPDTGAPLPALHPFVAVIALADVPHAQGEPAAKPLHEAKNVNDKGYGSFPICADCHREPSRHAGLKAHFYPRATARVATNMAGSTDGIGG